MPRIYNDIPNSDILAIYPYSESFIPRIGVVYKTKNGKEQFTLREAQIAEFLNKCTDIKNGGKNRKISQTLVDTILKETNGLSLEDCKYVYQNSKKSLEPKSTSHNFFYSISNSEETKSESSRKYWWEKDNIFEKIVNFAEELLIYSQNSRIYSLGQSPAWIVKAMGMISELKNEKRDFGFIPFSGSFLDRKEEHKGNFYKGDRPFPDKAKQLKYRLVLSKIGLSLDEIIEKAKLGKKTIILEYTNSGRSVASFAYILFSWANEMNLMKQLNESIEIVTFARRNSLPPVTSLNITNPLLTEIKCKNIYADNELLVGLANGQDEGVYSDRLVPKYPHNIWDIEPKLIRGNEDHINKLIEILAESLEAKKQSRVIQEELGKKKLHF